MKSTKQTTWNFNPLYESDTDPRIETEKKKLCKAAHTFSKKWKIRNDYLKNPNVLKEALDEYEQWTRNWGYGGKQSYYFSLRQSIDSENTDLKAYANKSSDLSLKIKNEMEFFEVRLSKISKDAQKKFLISPVLIEYRHFLKKLFEAQKHILTEPEEKILNLTSTTSYSNWTQMVSDFLSKDERKVLDEKGKVSLQDFSTISSLMNSSKKDVRKSSAQAFDHILEKHVDVAEREMNSILHIKKVSDELREYKRPDSARHLADDIRTSVVDTLIESVSENFKVSADFYRLKSHLLKQKKLEYYERNVEYQSVDKKYEFDEAVHIVSNTLFRLDPQLNNIFEMFVKKGHIDVYPRKGKRSGAFCAHDLITQPTYILLNFTKQTNDVLTLAHEVGHGINNELIRKKQNSLNFGTPTSTAEVASTFMEDFVIKELMKQANDKEKLALIMQKLNSDIGSIFRQVAFYNFETKLHKRFRKKGYLSRHEIGEIFRNEMVAHIGSSVNFTKENEKWWLYVPHFRYYFYVYSYASGLLISKALQKNVRENPDYIHKVKEFLSAGLSDSPTNLFKKLGVDITKKSFWESGIDEVKNTLTEAQKLAKNLKLV